MKRDELAKRLAQETGLSDAEAQNEVDQLVRNILKKLRQGQPVKVPGIGQLLGPKKK